MHACSFSGRCRAKTAAPQTVLTDAQIHVYRPAHFQKVSADYRQAPCGPGSPLARTPLFLQVSASTPGAHANVQAANCTR